MAQDVLADGFVSLCIDPSLNYFGGKCRVLVEGQFTGTGVTADTVVPVTSLRNVDTQFGAGSILAESLKKIFCQCPNNIELYAIGRADPVGAVVAAYTLTVTGPATSDGVADLFMIDGDYSVSVPVTLGDTATTIAANLAAAIPASFPYTVAVAAGVITLTAKNAGVIGNSLNAIYNWTGRANWAPAGVTVTQAQTVVGAGAPAVINYESAIGTCCYSCFISLSPDAAVKKGWNDYLATKWDCNLPMCFGHAYGYSQGSLGAVLASATNSPTMSVIAQNASDPMAGWLKVAAYGALSCCSSCDNPELSIQGRLNGVLSCLKQPSSCTSPWTFDEQNQLRAAGFVVTLPLGGGVGTYTNPYVTNDVTNYLYDANGRPNATFRDASSRRLAASTGISLATKLDEYAGLGLFTKNTDIKKGVFGTNPRLLLASIRAWAKDQVGVLFSEFKNIDSDIVLQTDSDVMPPCQGNPNKLHLTIRYIPPTRIGNIATTLVPSMLDNCNR